MIVRVIVSITLLSAAPCAFAQRELQASNANPYDRIIASQRTSSTDRLGMESSTRDTLPPADRAQAERVMRDFAQCVVRGDSATARTLLATAVGSAEERALMIRIADSRKGCLHQGRLRLKGNWMRGALAEQLYLRTYPSPVSSGAQPDAPAPAGSGDDKLRPYQAYAGCVVARNAPAADAVLRAEPGSAAEKAAYRDTMPTLSSCLAGGEESKLAIDRTTLRGYLAEALYVSRSSAG